MTYRNGALRCDRLLCTATVEHWMYLLARDDARAAGWHVPPCDCEWGKEGALSSVHDKDYCPVHFPQPFRRVETVRSPLL
jgi:hypothetical protein